MLRLLSRLIFGSPGGSSDPDLERIIDAATEKAVDATDPRIKALGDYRRTLHGPVTCAVQFVDRLVEALPPPRDARRETYHSDRSLRAFFSSAARMQEVFSTSPDLESYLADPAHRTAGDVHVALTMARTERKVLAPMLQGDEIRRDVERTLVSFDDHAAVLPAADEASLRYQVKERAFTTLLECALERIVARQEHTEELKRYRALLRTKLRAIGASRSGLDALMSSAAPRTSIAELQRELDSTEQALQEAVVSGDALERSLADLCATLEEPGGHIGLQRDAQRLDAMNYLIGEGADGADGDHVEFVRVSVRGRPERCGILARYPTAEIVPGDTYRVGMRRALDAGR